MAKSGPDHSARAWRRPGNPPHHQRVKMPELRDREGQNRSVPLFVGMHGNELAKVCRLRPGRPGLLAAISMGATSPRAARRPATIPLRSGSRFLAALGVGPDECHLARLHMAGRSTSSKLRIPRGPCRRLETNPVRTAFAASSSEPPTAVEGTTIALSPGESPTRTRRW
jgi:hypothetical protein